MKMDIDNIAETYKLCEATGKLRIMNVVDIELIKSKKMVSEMGLAFIKETSKGISKESPDWTFVFRDYYEALRGMIEAYLLFDRISSDNHQCMNAYICMKHPGLALDWEFLETVRLKRNAINYRGQLITYEVWDSLKLKFELHIKAISKAIDEKLRN
ncbi:MAG TPA: hypothetical protein HA362_02375 [Nanoarchaeota archaeon]|nr:hypothetical protein [Nanoarchaeota archaeon]